MSLSLTIGFHFTRFSDSLILKYLMSNTICQGFLLMFGSFGRESWVGTPFTNLIRHVAQYSTGYDDAIKSIQDAVRTCNLILGVGAHNSTQFAGIQYSFSVANVINETNFLPKVCRRVLAV